jgi:methanogenic corrinoid protein MtbC1
MMRNELSDSAARLFESEYAAILAVVDKRIHLEWGAHPDQQLDTAGDHLIETARHLGRLLRVIYRYRLSDALGEEFRWYVNLFATHGWGHAALSLVLDSWIVGIQGLVPTPECNHLAAPLQALREDLSRLFATAEARDGSGRPTFDPQLVEILLRGDVQHAQQHILSSPGGIASPARWIVDMLLPAMAEIGNRWERHQIEIFEEHLASQAIKSLLIRLPALPKAAPPQIGRTAMVTCAPGDQHELVPMAMSAYLEARGWKVRNLGGSLPAEQIVNAAVALEPDVLFITLTMVFLIDDLLAVLTGLRREFPSVTVIVGGRGTVPTRALLESRGARVARDFDDGHRLALQVNHRA